MKRPSSEEKALRRQIVEFVKKRGLRTEVTIVEHVARKLRLNGEPINYNGARYQLARCVEDGPLMWFGPNDLETPLKYRFDPFVSNKEKKMQIEGLAEIETLCALYRRLEKKGKPVESAVEALNKLGSRRPKKQRFSVSYNSKTSVLTVRAEHADWVPSALKKIAALSLINSIKQQDNVEA